MFFKSLLPAFLWALFILVICGIPGHDLPEVRFLDWLKPDKVIHLFVYAILSYLLINGLMKQDASTFLKNNSKTWAVVLSICYGILIEVLQKYVFIDRSGEVFDAMANAAGVFIGLWFFNMRKRKFASH
jgi:VanZ family protein